jgi:dTDP-4-dehydrorhamnose reductase
MTQTRILILGHTGQVAEAFREAALQFDEFDIITRGQKKCDVSNAQQVYKTVFDVHPDVIVNAAAYTAVDKAEDEPDRAFALNEKAVGHIAKAAKAQDIPVIHLSTDYVFDGTQNTPYQETDAVHPLGIYGKSKFAGEEILRQICEKNLILRTAWVYSPWGGNFVKTMLRVMTANAQIQVVNDQRGSPTAAIDIAKAILKIVPRLIETEFKDFGTYHLVSKSDVSWHDFACEIQTQALDVFGPDWVGGTCDVQAVPSSGYPTKAPRPAYTVLSGDKFKRVFGFDLPDWQSSLMRCLKALQEKGEGS